MPRTNSKTVSSKSLAELKRKVNKIAGTIETKYHDELQPAVLVSNGVESVSILSDPTASFTNQTRIGNEISPFHLRVKGTIGFNPAQVNTNQRVRMMIIQSKQGFVPQTTSTSSNTGVLTMAGTVSVVNSDFNYENRKHFTVLHDKTYIVDSASKPAILFNISKKISRKVVFEEASSTTAEQGQIRLLLFSDNDITNPPIVTWYSRMQYKDA